MKFIRTILTFLFFAAVIGLVGLFIFIEFNGKNFVEGTLSRKFNRPVSVSSVRLVFPVGLRIDDLAVKGVLKADEARATLSTDLIFRREPVFSQVIIRRPVFALMKTKDAPLAICMVAEDAPAPERTSRKPSADTAAKEAPAASGQVNIYINDLSVESGQVEYFDFTQEKPVKVLFDQVELKARDVAYPARSVKTKFSLSSVVVGEVIPISGGRAEAKGWIDIKKRDIQATLDLLEPGGRVGLAAVLEGIDNDLTIRGKVDLSGAMAPAQEGSAGENESVDQMIFGALSNSGIKLTANFSIKTKLDDIQIGAIAFGGELGAGGAGSLQENLKNIGKQFEAIGKKLTDSESQEPLPVNAVAQ